MSTGDLSIFCSLTLSLSSGVCNSPWRGHSHLLLNLLLGIWFFWGYYKWIVSIYSFSVCFLWVYRKANDFCKLILYPGTLLYLFMVSKSFWVEFLGSIRYRIISSENMDNLTVSLPICIPFLSYSCLIALARNSSTILNRSGDYWYPCLIPDFRGIGIGFSYIACTILYVFHI
jgi:hypothetical protein